MMIIASEIAPLRSLVRRKPGSLFLVVFTSPCAARARLPCQPSTQPTARKTITTGTAAEFMTAPFWRRLRLGSALVACVVPAPGETPSWPAGRIEMTARNRARNREGEQAHGRTADRSDHQHHLLRRRRDRGVPRQAAGPPARRPRRAAQLGWPREAIRVIDGDLGVSGSV